MMSDYLLRIIFKNRTISTFMGSDLVKTRRDAIDLAADYMRTHPMDPHAVDLSFQVIDEEGRLLLVLPADLVASKADSSTGRAFDRPFVETSVMLDRPPLKLQPDLISAGA
jgi:hypothetical protein